MQCVPRPMILTTCVFAVLVLAISGSAYAEDQAGKSDIVGKWNLDADAMSKLMEKQFGGDSIPVEQREAIKQGIKNIKMTFEFKADGTMLANVSMGLGREDKKEGKWSVVGVKGNVLTLQTTIDDDSDQVNVTVFSKDSIAVHPPKGEGGPVPHIPLKRAKKKEQVNTD